MKLDDGHVFPRDERRSMVIYKDWIASAEYMSDADFRAAMTAAIKYGTEGLSTDEILTWIKGLDAHIYHLEIIMFWFLGIKGSIDKPYDEWQRKKNGMDKKRNGKDIQSEKERVRNA